MLQLFMWRNLRMQLFKSIKDDETKTKFTDIRYISNTVFTHENLSKDLAWFLLILVRTGSIYLWLLETVPKGIMVNSLYKTLFALTHLFECVINSFEGRLLVIVHYSSAAMYNICSIFFSSFANTHIHAMVWSVVPFTAIFIKLIWK